MFIFNYFPEQICSVLKDFFKDNTNSKEKEIEEIRLRSNKPLIIKFNNYEVVLNIIVTTEDILETMRCICDNSIYAYQHELCNGFITIKGGHRIGITRKLCN